MNKISKESLLPLITGRGLWTATSLYLSSQFFKPDAYVKFHPEASGSLLQAVAGFAGVAQGIRGVFSLIDSETAGGAAPRLRTKGYADIMAGVGLFTCAAGAPLFGISLVAAGNLIAIAADLLYKY